MGRGYVTVIAALPAAGVVREQACVLTHLDAHVVAS
jgi:hypothetical protein